MKICAPLASYLKYKERKKYNDYEVIQSVIIILVYIFEVWLSIYDYEVIHLEKKCHCHKGVELDRYKVSWYTYIFEVWFSSIFLQNTHTVLTPI